MPIVQQLYITPKNDSEREFNYKKWRMAFAALCTIEYQTLPHSPTPISKAIANTSNPAPSRYPMEWAVRDLSLHRLHFVLVGSGASPHAFSR